MLLLQWIWLPYDVRNLDYYISSFHWHHNWAKYELLIIENLTLISSPYGIFLLLKINTSFKKNENKAGHEGLAT